MSEYGINNQVQQDIIQVLVYSNQDKLFCNNRTQFNKYVRELNKLHSTFYLAPLVKSESLFCDTGSIFLTLKTNTVERKN